MLAGLVTNDEKSEWNPSKSLTWLGVTVDLNKNTYQIAEERISSLLKSLFCVLNSPYTTARKLSRIAGKINKVCVKRHNKVENPFNIQNH